MKWLDDERRDSRRKKRLRAAIVLMWKAGLRIGEAVTLQRQHLLDSGEIRIRHGKGDKPRISALDSFGMMAIREWYAALPGNGSDFVVSKLGDPKIPANINRLRESIRQAGLAVGIERLHPHGLRHTFAATLSRNSSIEIVRRALGHARLNTTQEYLRKGIADHEIIDAIRSSGS